MSIPPGLESYLADELRELGLSGEVGVGGIELVANDDQLFAIHLWSQLAARVTVRLGRFVARDLDTLARCIRSLPWRAYAWPGQPIVVRATAHGSRLRFRDSVEKKVMLAIRDALRGAPPPLRRGPPPPELLVVVRIDDDHCTVSVDASGDRLHQRGWRRKAMAAPLRENLGAAVLRIAGWHPGMPLVDGMCGSGTFGIEAATVACGRAPGADRRFAFEAWPSCDAAAVKLARDETRAPKARDDGTAPILLADRDERAVEAARSNATSAHVDRRVQIVHSDLRALVPPAPAGLLVLNPPWGERLTGSIDALYASLVPVFERTWATWRIAILLPATPRCPFGRDFVSAASFSDGGTRVVVWAREPLVGA